MIRRNEKFHRKIRKRNLYPNKNSTRVSDSEDKIALIHAVQNQEEGLALALIAAGADVNRTDNNGKTALIHAVQHENESLAHALIDAGSDVNINDFNNKTALIYAVGNFRQNDMVGTLINAGARVNKPDSQRKTPLIHAVQNDKERLSYILIRAGASVDAIDEERKTALLYAIKNTNDSLAFALIKAGANVNVFDEERKTALIHAIEKNRENVVGQLIKEGAYVNFSDVKGKTALFYAVQNDNESILQALIEARANVNVRNKTDSTALFYAVQNDNESIFQALIKAGADVNIINAEGQNALFYAALNGSKAVVTTMIAKGADLNIRDNRGRNAVLCAVLNDKEDSVNALIDAGADVNITDDKGQTPLAYAVLNNNEAISCALIEAEANVNIANETGETALFYAVQNDNESILQALIEAGADVNKTDKMDQNALFHTVLNDKEDSVNALIVAGADVNVIDYKGQTPLAYAVLNNLKGIACALIEAGADVNITVKKNVPILIQAFLNKQESIVRALTKARADVNITDDKGQTPLAYAVLNNNEAISCALIEAGADVNITVKKNVPILIQAILNKQESIVRALIKASADVNVTNYEGKTALIIDIEKGKKKFVSKLIDAGTDVNIFDNKKKTALTHAVENDEDKDLIRTLIEAGADVNITDNEDKTALIYAVLNNNDCLAHALIEAGADVNKTDEEYRTALIYAVENENEELACKLIKRNANVNITDKQNKSVLIHALQNERLSIFFALIDAGGDVNITDGEGKTALLYYVLMNNDKNGIVQALIDAGADVNKTDDEGNTPLIYAIQNESEPLTKALIEGRADVHIANTDGKTALFFATANENELLVNMLIEAGSFVHVTDNDSKTPLFYAVANEYVICELVDNGKSNVNSTDAYGRTPLFYSFTKSLASSQRLLEKGGNLLVKDNCRVSILTFFIDYCLKKSDKSYMSDGFHLFIEQGMAEKEVFNAIINAVFCKILYSYSMLKPAYDALELARIHYSASNEKCANDVLNEVLGLIRDQPSPHTVICHLPRILFLLNQLGVDPNTADSQGNTALHYAACLPFIGVSQEALMDILRQLDRLGASFNIKNHKNERPLSFCLCRAIDETDKKKVNRIIWPKEKLFVQVCKFLLYHGSSLEDTTQNGESIFHLLLNLFQHGQLISNFRIRRAILDEVLLLLKFIVNRSNVSTVIVNRRNTNLNSPLHLWAMLELSEEEYDFVGHLKSYNAKILQHLLRCGVQLNPRNSNDQTPLHLCRTWTAVNLLLDAGANPNTVDITGSPPLLVAAKNNKLHQSSRSFYPDVFEEPKCFWTDTLKSHLDSWTVNKHEESVLSVLIESEAFVLAKALLELASEKRYLKDDSIAASLLNTICKDGSTRANWKSALAEIILTSRTNPVPINSKDDDTPLHYCCRNIVGKSEESSVHWTIAKLLLSYGANCETPNAKGVTCLGIADAHPKLKTLLTKPINIDDIPLLIPWLAVSKRYQPVLAKVARRQECEHVETFWFHKDHLASGSFGLVFAGINEKDGREVAIKRIESERMKRREDQREITNLTALADCEQVVRYLSFFEDKHFSYVVLELMEGNLDEYLGDCTFDIKGSGVKLCKDVVMGLEFLHRKKIIHRDLKSTNILYRFHPSLRLKIADFGLSRRINSNSTTVYGTNAGTKCWIAPEVLKATDQHSFNKQSDIFSCGLILHYILSVKRHPFSPADCTNKSLSQIDHETESNVLYDKMEGWDNSIFSEAEHLVKLMLQGDESESKRPTAEEALCHPFFWSNEKKIDLLCSVGNQPEIERPRAKTSTLTAVETDIENSFGIIVKHAKWNDPGFVNMPAIYAEMTRRRKTPYITYSVVELLRFIRNAYSHVSEDKRPTPIRKQLLEDFVFLEYFPGLVMEVYKAVTTHGWDQREEIKYAMNK